HHCKRADGKCSEPFDLRRVGKESEGAPLRQRLEPGEVLADEYAGEKKDGVGGSREIARVVDVVGVDADKAGAARGKLLGRLTRDIRMLIVPVRLGAPMPAPSSLDEQRLSAEIEAADRCRIDRARGSAQ